MKLTKTKLKRIIKEELKKVLQENKSVGRLIADISAETEPADWNNPVAVVNKYIDDHPELEDHRTDLLYKIAEQPNIFFDYNPDYASSIADDAAAIKIKKEALIAAYKDLWEKQPGIEDAAGLERQEAIVDGLRHLGVDVEALEDKWHSELT